MQRVMCKVKPFGSQVNFARDPLHSYFDGCQKNEASYIYTLLSHRFCSFVVKWAVLWQNQQNDCVPSEDSDQPGHPPSLIRVFAVRIHPVWSESLLCAQWVATDLAFFMWPAKALIRLGGCPGWSETSLAAQAILLVLSWCGSTFTANLVT